MSLSIIIPCYNEQDRLPSTLKRVVEYLSSSTHTEFEILVIDNGSTDNTKKIVEEMSVYHPEIRLMSHKSYGKGWAVKQGMMEAKGEYRLFMDADNSTDISHLETMLPYLQQGYGIVISSRRIVGAVITKPQPWHRQILGNIFAGTVRIIVPLGIKDTQNGFKLFTAKVADDIFPRQSMYFWAFDIEILAIAKKRGYKIKEVPITWKNDDQSRMNFKGMMRMLFEVINIRLMLFTNK